MLKINNIKTNILAIAAVALTICSAPLAMAENYTREFDEQEYLRQNRDVAELIRQGKFNSGYEHYTRYGQYENRRGAFKTFNEQEYLRQNRDVAELVRQGKFKSGYDHYLKHGQYENRRGAFQTFNEQEYLRQNPDVAEAVRRGEFNSGYEHYTRYGQDNNRRDAFKTFNEQEYLRQNPDVVKAVRRGEFKSGYDHYLKHGQYENRHGVSTSPQVQQPPIVGNNWSCESINRSWSQEAFFRTKNRLIHICRYGNSNKLAWFERSRDSSEWTNFPVEVAYNGFVNARTGYFVNDTELLRRQGNRVIYREQVLTKWRHNYSQVSPYSTPNTF